MKHKTSLFFFLANLLILSVLGGVSFAHAAVPNPTFSGLGCLADNWFFHLECSGTGSSRVCELSQVQNDNPVDGQDFKCWLDQSLGNATTIGVRSALEETSNDNNISKIVLAGDLNLGYDSRNKICNLNVGMLGPDHAGFDGQNHTIQGLCYEGTSNFALFEEIHGAYEFGNVKFTNVHLIGTTADTELAILAKKMSNAAAVKDVTVENAYFKGASVGGLINFIEHPANSTNNSCSIQTVTLENISYDMFQSETEGSGFGGVIREIKSSIVSISDVHLTNLSIGKEDIASNYYPSSYELDGGGIVGSVHSGSEVVISNSTIELGEITSSLTKGVFGGVTAMVENANVTIADVNVKFNERAQSYNIGGVVGYASDNITNISNVVVESGNNGFIGGGLDAGGVVGCVQNIDLKVSGASVNVGVISNMNIAGGASGGIVGISKNSNLLVSKASVEHAMVLSSYGFSGGIIGQVDDDEDHGQNPKHTVVKNTYSVGLIFAEVKGISGSGYIIGQSKSFDSNDSLYNNFHFGESVVYNNNSIPETSDMGGLGVGNYTNNSNPWSVGSYFDNNIFGNVRNPTTNYTASGSLGYYVNIMTETGSMPTPQVLGTYTDFFLGRLQNDYYALDRIANGVASESDMKSGLFAALLNYNLESRGQEAIWVSKGGGLPTFAKGSDKPNHLVVLETTDLQSYLASAQLTNQPGPIQKTFDHDNMDWNESVNKTGITIYTDENGELSTDFKSDVQTIRTTGGNAFGQDFLFVDGNGNEILEDGTFSTIQRWYAGEAKKLFCFKKANTDVLNLYQTTFSVDNENCFEYWYDGTGNDARTYAQNWLDYSFNRSIVLTSDIEFAGTYDNNGTTDCVDAPNAFKGQYLELGDGDQITSESGVRHTISGLCKISTADAYFALMRGTASFKDVAFKHVYFKGDKVNILQNAPSTTLSGEFSNIAVDSSDFKGADKAAAIFADVEFDGNVVLSSITVSNVNVEAENAYASAGAVIGYTYGLKGVNDVTISDVSINGAYAGGVVGSGTYLSTLSFSNISLSNATITGEMVGGITSHFYNSGSDAGEVSYSDIAIQGSITGSTVVGGLVGYLDENFSEASVSIQRVNVIADISVGNGSFNNYSRAAGGLVGCVYKNNNENLMLTIKNTYTKGDITSASTASLGYLIGIGDGLEDNDNVFIYDVTDNYHFGTNDASVTLGFGSFSADEWKNPRKTTNPTVNAAFDPNNDPSISGVFAHDHLSPNITPANTRIIARNFRNAGSSSVIVPDGSLQYSKSQPIANGADKYSNGMIADDDMKTPFFAAVMNWEAGNWTLDSDFNGPLNDGLPVLVDASSAQPIYAVRFNMDSFNNIAGTAQKDALRDGLAGGYKKEYVEGGSAGGLVLLTDETGKLSSVDVYFVKSLVGDLPGEGNFSTSWAGSANAPALAASSVYNNGGFVYTYSGPSLYFCFEENGDALEFSQTMSSSNPTAGDKKCFDYWYNDNCATRGASNPDSINCDARTYAQAWLDGNNSDLTTMKKIVLKSDIAFAGKDVVNNNTVCVDAPNAFKGKYLELGENDVFTSEAGVIDTVSGLCYESASESVRFVNLSHKTANITNVAFDSVYFNGEIVGILSANTPNGYDEDVVSIKDIFIKNSEFKGNYGAGAVANNITFISSYNAVQAIVQNVKLSNVKVTSNGYYAGGLIGFAYAQYNSLEISNILADNVTVVAENGDAGGLIGQLQSNDYGLVLEKNSVSGSVEGGNAGGLVGQLYAHTNGIYYTIVESSVFADVTSNSGEKNAGGLVGLLHAYVDDFSSLYIVNNYVISNIASGNNRGYLVARVQSFDNDNLYSEIKEKLDLQITDNYHYGTNDPNVFRGIGVIGTSPVNDWNNPALNSEGAKCNIARNFRNAITTGTNTLAADGVLYYDAATPIHGSGADKFVNGVISEEQMKSPRLAAVLNMGAANAADMAWTVKKDNITGNPVNEGLPVFVGNGENPSFPVTFDLADFDIKASKSQRDNLSAASSIHPVDSIGANVDGSPVKGVVLFTDNDGRLASNDVSFANGLLVYDDNISDVWKDGQGSTVNLNDPSLQFDNGLTVYTFSSQHPIPYFCFADSTNANGDVVGLKFSQINVASPSTNDGTCFAYWYNDNADHANGATPDAYSYAQKWLDANEGSIALTTDINFAGHTGNVCNEAPNAFKGKYLSLKKNDVITSEDGDTYKKIAGLCYESSADGDQVAFARISYWGDLAKLTKVTFSDVFFKLTGNNTEAGVLLIPAAPLGTISDINVEGADIQASLAGAIAGNLNYLLTATNITVSDINIQGDTVGGIFGKYSLATNKFDLTNIAVSVKENGSINGTAYAGGLVGWMEPSSNQTTRIKIYRTYSNGDITGSSSALVGYLIGTLGDVSAYDYTIYANYHYGYTDASVVSGIGNMVDWNTHNFSDNGIYLNFRNAVAGLEPDGDLRLPYYYKPAIHGSSRDYHNGVIPSKQMKNARLAAVLNLHSSSWTIVENKNDGLPVFATGDDKYSFAVFLDYASFDKLADAVHKDRLNDAIANGDYQLDVISHDYANDKDVYGIGLFTDNKGHLSQADIAFAESLQGETKLWVGGDALNTSVDYSSSQAEIFEYETCPGNNEYFHLVCADATDPSNPRECRLSQIQTTIPASGTDFACWNAMRAELNKYENKSSKIVLDGSLDLGGYDETSGRCYFSIGPLGSSHKGLEGNGKTIEGLCNISLDDFGFFEQLDGSYDNHVEVKNVKFKNVHIEGRSVGVLASSLEYYGSSGPRYVDFSGVTIENVNLRSSYRAGVIAAYLYGFDAKLDNVTVIADTIQTPQGVTTFDDDVSWGGLVGRVQGALEISNSRVEALLIKNSITTFSNTNDGIMIGGIVGSMEDNITLSNTIVEGNIESPIGIVGGIAGGTSYETNINKVAFKGELSGNTVGGLVGRAQGALEISNSRVEALLIKNSITTFSNTNDDIMIGGIVGSMEDNITLSNTIVEGNIESPIGIVGGIAGETYYGTNINKVAFKGKVSGNTVGGIVGRQRTGWDTYFNIIKNTYTVGKIEQVGTNGSAGYIVGEFDYDLSENDSLYNNYHFSLDDAAVEYGVGSYHDNGQPVKVDDAWWNNPSISSNYRNFRNAITTGTTTLSADGDLHYGPEPIYYDDGTGTITKFVNGVIPEVQMKSRRFAAVLNSGNFDNSQWTVVDGENDGLPIIATGSNKPVYPVNFDLTSFYAHAGQDQVKALNDSLDAKLRFKDFIGWDGNGGYIEGLVLYTNNEGHLVQEDIDFVTGLLATNASWRNTNGTQALNTTEDFTPPDSYTDRPLFTYSSCLGGNDFFHLVCADDGNGPECHLSQIPTTTPISGTDFACWDEMLDVLDNSSNKNSKIVLESDLDLGGYDDVGNRCYMTFAPIVGRTCRFRRK